MTTLHQPATASVAYSKGAADDVLASCTDSSRSAPTSPLTEADRERVRAIERQMAARGTSRARRGAQVAPRRSRTPSPR